MSDLIQTAIEKSSEASRGKVQTPVRPDNEASAAGTKDFLPTKKNARLAKKQLAAEKTKAKSKLNELLRTGKQKALSEGKKILKQLAKQQLAGLKLPVTDAKILQTVILAKKKKQETESRQNEVAEEYEKNAEAFEYPMAPETPAPATSPTPVEIPITSGTPVQNVPKKMKYEIEVSEKPRSGVWRVEVFDVVDAKSFLDVILYGTKQYPTRSSVIAQVTNEIRTTGVVGFPPQPDF